MLDHLLVPIMALGFLFIDLFNGSDDDEEEAVETVDETTELDTDPVEDPAEDPATDPEDDTSGATVAVANGQIAEGTGGNDLFTLASDPAEFLSVDIDAGAGDDTLTLDNNDGMPGVTAAIAGSAVDGGAGDDVIAIFADSSMIDGGTGDDTITGSGVSNSIMGGDGDDVITYQGGPSDADILDGGAGNDTLTSAGSLNSVTRGGAGDDVLFISGLADGGAGYVTVADGGTGDDTINHALDQPNFANFATLNEDGGATGPARLTGGAGADVFNIALTQAFADGFTQTDADNATDTGPINITDFASGEDQLVIDLTEAVANVSATTASLVEDTNAGTTEMTLMMETPEGVPVELTISMTGTGISWDDVAFVGDSPSLVDPVQD